MTIKQQSKPVLAASTPVRRPSGRKVTSPAGLGLVPIPIRPAGTVASVSALARGPASPLAQTAVLDLQRTVGNRQVASLLGAAPAVLGRSDTALRRNSQPISFPPSRLPSFPTPLQRAPKTAAPKEISTKQTEAALAWAAKANLGREAILALQASLAVEPATGVYDEATAAAVYLKQQSLKIGADGKAGPTTFARLGLILTNEITAAGVADEQLAEVQRRFPTGVTVAIYPHYKNQSNNNKEFKRQADPFAKAEGAIGLDGGNITIGGEAVIIKELGDVIETVQGIHRGLLAKHEQTQAAAPGGGAPADGAASKPPAFTKVRNLALFSHGMEYGMALDAANRFKGGGLMSEDKGLYPSNIAAFVKGISDAVTEDVHVQLFACNTAHDTKRTDYEEWTKHGQGDRSGAKSFAAALAGELGPEASVYGHTTTGHTTENFAALVFGKDAGGGAGGLHMFDRLYPETFIQSELARLYPDKTEPERALLHDSLRELMWKHYKDSISAEHKRSGKAKRYDVQIGKEMFVRPDNAATLLQQDWTTWGSSRLTQVKPAKSAK